MHTPNIYASPTTATAPIVVKYGGNAMTGDAPDDPVLTEVAELHRSGTPVLLVHGGGPEIDRWLALRGVETHRIDGLRVTDEITLEVTEAVLCGTLNKRIVRTLAHLSIRAAGISGQDAATLVAGRITGSHGEELGFVGGRVRCDPTLVRALMSAGILPVIAPLAVSEDAHHALNVNADSAAAAVAGALDASAFILITNVTRVRRDPADPASGIDRLSLDEARAFAASPACAGGMQPKMEAAIEAVARGARASYICAAGPQAIMRALEGEATIVG